jgi:hypothetical protein
MHDVQVSELFKLIQRWKKKAGSYPQKVRLLLINTSCWKHRKELVRVVEERLGIYNSYGLLTTEQYHYSVASSKFVLCPVGLGWDCYRIWEALLLGSIPIIEHSPGWKLGQGWDRTFEDLPVLWVEDYSVLTIELMEDSYGELLAKQANFNFEKLTQQYWAERVLRIALGQEAPNVPTVIPDVPAASIPNVPSPLST